MGRYKERDISGPAILWFIPPAYEFEIEDTETGRIGRGAGSTKREARDRAWIDLKYGKPKYIEGREPSVSKAHDGAGGDIGDLGGLGALIGGLMVFFVAIGVVWTAINEISVRTERTIKRIWPSYETREEKGKKGMAEWQKTRNFFANSEKQFIVTRGEPILPQAELVYLVKRKVVKSKSDGSGSKIIRNISADKYIEEYDRDWMMTEATPEVSPKYYSYRTDYVFSPNKKRALYMEIKKEWTPWGIINRDGKFVLKDLQTGKMKRVSYGGGENTITITPQAWSPDGTQVAVGIHSEKNSEIIKIINWGRGKNVYMLNALGKNPAWSPDGNWIAFEHNGEIFLFEIGAVDPKTIKKRLISYKSGSPISSRSFVVFDQTSLPIATGNIIRIGKGERPFWLFTDLKSRITAFKSKSQNTVKKSLKIHHQAQDLISEAQSELTQQILPDIVHAPHQKPFTQTPYISTTPLSIPKIQVPDIQSSSQTPKDTIVIYILTDTNYDPANWRVTPKSVEHKYKGKWSTYWELDKDSPNKIRCIIASGSRSIKEHLPSGHRDIYVVIDEF